MFACISLIGFSHTWTIFSSGDTFSPDSISVNTTDTIVFSLASIHDAVEVTYANWVTPANAPFGGMTVPFGGGTVLASSLSVGPHYYICQNHYSMGMKGRIYVVNTTGIPAANVNDGTDFSIFPNPASGTISVNYSMNQKANVIIKVMNVTGQNEAILLNETKDKGTYLNSFDIDKNGMAKGIYIMELIIGDYKSTKRFIVE